VFYKQEKHEMDDFEGRKIYLNKKNFYILKN